ncbi:MAG: HepT-like ribonuclease domain-containing protein [Methanoculleaceae archaeon]
MSKRSPLLFIQDMLEAIEKIERYTESIKDLEDFRKRDIVVDAVLRNLEIIGEAARNIPEEIRSKYPEIPWNRVVGLRNVVIHGYFVVDLEIIWVIINKQLPELKEVLLKMLEEMGEFRWI